MLQIPSHVPADRVYDWDFNNDPGFGRDPQAHLNDLAHIAPRDIFYTPHNGGHWVFTGYEVIFEAMRDVELFTSTDARIPGDPDRTTKMIPVEIDPPLHARYRTILNTQMSPKAIKGLEDLARANANNLIDALVGTKQGEFVHAFAEPMPILMIMNLFGMPVERFHEYREIAKGYFRSRTPEDFAFWADKILNRQSALLDDRIRSPRDDIASALISTKYHGEPLSYHELLQMFYMIFAAGLETQTNAFGFLFRHLAEDLELQAGLRAEPALIAEAVEESLRRYAFVNLPRTVARDGEFHGFRLKKRDKVYVALSIAGLDERKISHPLQFDIEREKKDHVAFGIGPHRCAGSHLARMELRVAAEEWMRRVVNFRLVGEPRTSGNLTLFIERLELAWDRVV